MEGGGEEDEEDDEADGAADGSRSPDNVKASLAVNSPLLGEEEPEEAKAAATEAALSLTQVLGSSLAECSTQHFGTQHSVYPNLAGLQEPGGKGSSQRLELPSQVWPKPGSGGGPDEQEGSAEATQHQVRQHQLDACGAAEAGVLDAPREPLPPQGWASPGRQIGSQDRTSYD